MINQTFIEIILKITYFYLEKPKYFYLLFTILLICWITSSLLPFPHPFPYKNKTYFHFFPASFPFINGRIKNLPHYFPTYTAANMGRN